jgi:WD40 repeat protein
MDHTVRLYDLNNFKARMSYRAHVDSVNSINWIYYSNNFVTGSADKTCSMWDMRTNICTSTFYGHNNAVNAAIVENSGTYLASCDADGIVKFWYVRMVREIATFYECKQSANCLCFDKSGNLLAVGYDDSNIRIFSGIKKCDAMYKGHEDAVLDLLYDPNNASLLSC